MMTLDGEGQRGEPMLTGKDGAGGLVVRPSARRSETGLSPEQVILPGRIELADVVPETQVMAQFTRTEWLSKVGGATGSFGEVVDQRVPLAIIVARVSEHPVPRLTRTLRDDVGSGRWECEGQDVTEVRLPVAGRRANRLDAGAARTYDLFTPKL
jgi:hypothetical protein